MLELPTIVQPMVVAKQDTFSTMILSNVSESVPTARSATLTPVSARIALRVVFSVRETLATNVQSVESIPIIRLQSITNISS